MFLKKGSPAGILDHPIISGSEPIGLMSGDNPRYPGRQGGHQALLNDLNSLGLKYDETDGKYGMPEKSVIVHSPSRQQMYDLGKRHGQEAVIHSQGGKHTFLYTHGPDDGLSHPGTGTYDHWPEGSEEPDDNFTKIPGNGYLRLHFDFNKKDGPQPVSAPTQETAQDEATKKHEIAHSLYLVLKKAYSAVPGEVDQDTPPAAQYPEATPSFPWLPHPHAYPWHDGHTDHHFQGSTSGGVLVGTGLTKHDGPTMPKHPHTDGAIPNQNPVNDQAAGKGVATYRKFALPFGTIHDQPSNLTHYDYSGKNDAANKLVADHGFSTYYAGGKYGKPDLSKRNYNTKHLMVYDPTPQSGGDFGDEKYTDTWRKVHELSHATTYPELNKMYGEGRRIGKLGVHRTTQEALRAVHWEWLAAHKQRELSASMGIHIPDETFHKELNTVMHDAAHRAVTGKFTEPSEEGFTPHSHKVPLETSLGLVREAARNLGLQGNHDLVKKSEGAFSVSDTKKQLGVPEVLHALHGKLVKRIDEFAKEALALRKRETDHLATLKKDDSDSLTMGEMKKDSESDLAMSECKGTAMCKCSKCEGLTKYAKGEKAMKKAAVPMKQMTGPGAAVPGVKMNNAGVLAPPMKGPGMGNPVHDKLKPMATSTPSPKFAAKAEIPSTTKEVPGELDEGSGGDISKGKSLDKAAWMPAAKQAESIAGAKKIADTKSKPKPVPAPVKKAGMGMGAAPAAGGAAPKPAAAGATPKLPGMGGGAPKPAGAGAMPKPAGMGMPKPAAGGMPKPVAPKTPALGAGSPGAMKSEKKPVGKGLKKWEPGQHLTNTKPAPQLGQVTSHPAAIALKPAPQLSGSMAPPSQAPTMAARVASRMPTGGGLAVGQSVQGGASLPPMQAQGKVQTMAERVASRTPSPAQATGGLQLPGAHLFGGSAPTPATSGSSLPGAHLFSGAAPKKKGPPPIPAQAMKSEFGASATAVGKKPAPEPKLTPLKPQGQVPGDQLSRIKASLGKKK